MKPAYRLFFARRLHLLAIGCTAAALLGQLPHWLAELFSHFMPHYALVMLAAGLVCSGRRRTVWLLLGVLLTGLLIQPLPHPVPPEQPQHSLLWYNVHLHNPDAAAESRRMVAWQPDVVALAEINLNDAGWQALRAAYPHGCEHRDDGSPFALVLWSRRPLDSCHVRFAGAAGLDFPYIRAQMGPTTLYALHPPPPVSEAMAIARNHYLHTTATEMAHDVQVLAVGDLNSSPYSPVFRHLTTVAGVAPQTLFALPTWQPLWLNIDHVLARNLRVSVQAMPWQGSDHRPMRVFW